MTLEIDVVTLFPAMIEGPLAESIPGRIQERGLVQIRTHDLREWGIGRHRSVDDAPYGGGAGMVMRPEPIAAALEALRRPESLVILLDPGGERLQPGAGPRTRRPQSHLVLICPRYEGVDERIRALVDLELSIGDYVLTGGELPALVVIDAVIRLLPGRDRRRFDGRGIVRGRPARVPAVHPAAVVPRQGRAADPRQRRSRRRAPLAAAGIAAPDARPAAGPARRPQPSREEADLLRELESDADGD